MMMMKAALVTGATTPFGRALVASLLDDGARVLAVGIEPRWPAPPRDGLTYVAIDLTRSRDLRDLLFGPARDHEITGVVHSAHHRSLRARGRRAHALNVEVTRELLQLAERHPSIQRFVYAGAAEIYRAGAALPALIGEDHPIEMAPQMPQRVRDRVEADFTVCAKMGMADLSIAVLRFAEILAPHSGSQLADYLESRVCYRPIGFDPMLDVLSIDDAVRATRAALASDRQGVFNIPGADVLPLSRVIERAGRVGVPVPGPVIGPLYAARSLVLGRLPGATRASGGPREGQRAQTRAEFDWTLNRWRFRWSGVLDGTRAREELGYAPAHPIEWSAVVTS